MAAVALSCCTAAGAAAAVVVADSRWWMLREESASARAIAKQLRVSSNIELRRPLCKYCVAHTSYT
jgi:RNase P subunit RPR2